MQRTSFEYPVTDKKIANQHALDRYNRQWTGERAETTRELYSKATEGKPASWGCKLQDTVIWAMGGTVYEMLDDSEMTPEAQAWYDWMIKGFWTTK